MMVSIKERYTWGNNCGSPEVATVFPMTDQPVATTEAMTQFTVAMGGPPVQGYPKVNWE